MCYLGKLDRKAAFSLPIQQVCQVHSIFTFLKYPCKKYMGNVAVEPFAVFFIFKCLYWCLQGLA